MSTAPTHCKGLVVSTFTIITNSNKTFTIKPVITIAQVKIPNKEGLYIVVKS